MLKFDSTADKQKTQIDRNKRQTENVSKEGQTEKKDKQEKKTVRRGRQTDRPKRQTPRQLAEIIVRNCASFYTAMKKQNEDITQSGQNQCHITGVIKAYFGHTFHLRPKKDRQAGRQTKKIELTVRKTERQTRERHQFYRETDKRKTS